MSRTRSLSKLIGPSGSQAFDTNTLVIDAANNRVGIGTTAPTYKNHTYGTNGTAYTATGSTGRTPEGTLITAQAASGTTGVSATIDMLANGQHAWIGAVDVASGYTPHMVFGQSTGSGTWAERMRIASSGNVGIGTSSPSSLLDVDQSQNAETNIELTNTNTGSSAQVRTKYTTDGGLFTVGKTSDAHAFGGDAYLYNVDNTNIRFATSDTERMRINSLGNVGIGDSSPSNFGTDSHGLSIDGTGNYQNIILKKSGVVQFVIFTNGASGTFINQATAQPMMFLTNDTERMRLDASGQLIVGGTAPVQGSKVGIQGGSSVNRLLTFEVTHTTAFGAVGFHNGNGNVGSISMYSTSVAYNTTSDYRLKTDAQPMTGASERVLALKPVNFAWIVDGSRVDGFLAHEAQAVVPECATGTKDAMRDEEYEVTAAVLDADGMVVTEAVMGTRSVPDYQGIDQSKLVPLLTAALQEAITKIQVLEARLTAAGIE